MPVLDNPSLALHVSDDASVITLTDKRRRQTWRLDRSRQHYRVAGDAAPRPLPAGTAVADGGGGVVVSYVSPEGRLTFRWTLHEDHVQVTMVDAQVSRDVQRVALPGPFVPEAGRAELAVPVFQGLLIRPGNNAGAPWEQHLGHGGHLNLTMCMGAAMTGRAALLAVHRDPAHWSATIGEGGGASDASGPFFFFEQQVCPADGWGDATVRLYPTDPGVTAVCKRYRQILRQENRFVGWDQKLAAKPILRQLFGGLMAFIGYNGTPDLDYAAAAQRLRDAGFDWVFYYPVRMCQYSLGFRMGGDAPIWLSDEQIAAMRAVDGAHLSPWAWVFEGLDDGTEQMRRQFRRDAALQHMPHWKIDDAQWYQVCTPYQVRHMQQRFAGDLRQMDWVHFDVSAMFPGRPCFDREHEDHAGQVLSCGGDREQIARLFSPATVGNRIVSSEGFADHYAPYYDIGTTKILPSALPQSRCTPVPMTMLVFHDSCVHDWWELHNYNPIPGFGLYEQPHGLGRVGSGLPHLKAAMDALYGCPPNVFAFGKQYAWSDFAARKTYSFLIRLDDDPVQEALRLALPVTKLHRRLGTQEMTAHELLSDDAAVQQTTFADGTRIIANLSDGQREVDGVGRLAPHSWCEVGE